MYLKYTTTDFKRIEIVQSTFSNYNEIILEIINRKMRKIPGKENIWKINNILVNNPVSQRGSHKINQKISEFNENSNITNPNYRMYLKQCLKENLQN